MDVALLIQQVNKYFGKYGLILKSVGASLGHIVYTIFIKSFELRKAVLINV